MSAAAFRQQVQVFVSQALSPQAISARLAQKAKETNADNIRSRRASPFYRRYVDGIEGAPEESVRPDGVIVYKYEYIQEIITFAVAFMKARGPRAVMTAKNYANRSWQDSFYLGLDGKFVEYRRFNPEKMGPVKEVVIGNMQPYHRKVETQLVGTKKLKFSVPPGTFADAAKQIRQRYGNLVKVEWRLKMYFPGIYRLKGDQTQPVFRGGVAVGTRFRRRAGDPVDSPALVITVY